MEIKIGETTITISDADMEIINKKYGAEHAFEGRLVYIMNTEVAQAIADGNELVAQSEAEYKELVRLALESALDNETKADIIARVDAAIASQGGDGVE